MRQPRLAATALAALVLAACGNTTSKMRDIGRELPSASRAPRGRLAGGKDGGIESRLIPLDLSQYQGKSCAQYPDLALVERIGPVNVFWLGGEYCGNEAGVDQQAALSGGRTIAKYVNEGIQQFLQMAGPASSEWKKVIDEKVLPIDLQVYPTEWGGAMSSGVADVDVYSAGQTIHLTQRRYIVVNALMNSDDRVACDTVVMHEVAHCISSGLGRLRMNSLLEEAWADIAGTSLAQFVPRFGDGYGQGLRRRYEALLQRTDLTPQRRKLIEARLAGTSATAYRDFTKSMPYPDAYSVPEPHVISNYVNHLKYRVGTIVGHDLLAQRFFTLYLSHPELFYTGDLYQFMSSVLSPWAENSVVMAVLAELKWQPSIHSSGQFHFTWETSTMSTKQKLLKIANDETLNADIFPGPFAKPFMTLQFQGTPLLSFDSDYAYSDWADPKSHVVLTAETRSEPCPAPSAMCLCDRHWNDLKFFGTYKSRDGKVHRTAPQVFPPPQALGSNCYDLSVIEMQ